MSLSAADVLSGGVVYALAKLGEEPPIPGKVGVKVDRALLESDTIEPPQ